MICTNSTRHFHLTPGHCLLALLAVEFLLFLSQWFRWLPKGWPVLIAVAAVCVVMAGMFVWLGVALVYGRRFQFSLRSLLVLVVVVALLCSWFMVELKVAREQKAAVEGIEKLGGGVIYDYEVDQFDKQLVEPSAPLCLRNLLGSDFLGDVVGVSLWDAKVTDTWFEHLKGFNKLDAINLAGTPITDSGLEQLALWPKLRYLYLDYTGITNLGLERLRALRQLRVLSLNGTRITDDGLRQLRGLSNLRDLVLPFTAVTDGGLESLEDLTKLESLILSGTKVTTAGIAKLQQALPNCKITR